MKALKLYVGLFFLVSCGPRSTQPVEIEPDFPTKASCYFCGTQDREKFQNGWERYCRPFLVDENAEIEVADYCAEPSLRTTGVNFTVEYSNSSTAWVAYLGVRESSSFTGWPLYAEKKEVSELNTVEVWGLPVTGIHVFQIDRDVYEIKQVLVPEEQCLIEVTVEVADRTHVHAASSTDMVIGWNEENEEIWFLRQAHGAQVGGYFAYGGSILPEGDYLYQVYLGANLRLHPVSTTTLGVAELRSTSKPVVPETNIAEVAIPELSGEVFSRFDLFQIDREKRFVDTYSNTDLSEENLLCLLRQ